MMFRKEKKVVYIGIHGFGLTRHKEFDCLAEYFAKAALNFECFDLYSTKADDSDWTLWVKRAHIKVCSFIDRGYLVHLIGFSMGGVIASHLASYLPIESLVLLAPAYEYLGVSSLKNLATDYLQKDKEGRKRYFENRKPPTEYFIAFEALVRKLKNDIKKVSCPLLMIHGTLDEYVPARSTKKGYRQALSDKKRLIFIEEAPHELHLHKAKTSSDVCRLVLLFVKKEIVY